MISIWIHYLIPENHYRYTIFLRNQYENYYLLHDFTLNSLFFRELTLNPLSFLRNHFEFVMKSLWIHYKITMNSPHSSRLHYLFREFSLNSLSFSQIHLESTFFCIMTMNSLTASRFTVNTLSFSRIHYFFLQIFYEITICCAIFSFNSLFFFANSLSVTRIHFESTIWFGKPLWIRFEITMKRFWNHYEIAIFLAIFPLRDFTMNSLSISRLH